MTNTIILPRSVVEQALEALFMYKPMVTGVTFQHGLDAMQALRAALEQPQVEQEPVAWIEHEWSGSGLRHLHFERPAPTVRDEVVRPVWTPLYLHPQPPRQPLTDDEINNMDVWLRDTPFWRVLKLARAIERAHGIGGEA